MNRRRLNKRNAPTFAEARGAVEALGRAIDAATVARAEIVRGLKRRNSHARKLQLAAALGQALRGKAVTR